MRNFYVAISLLLMSAFGFQAHAQNARVQIIHNSGDPAARLVDVLVDGGVAVERLAYREATSYVDIPAGDREVGIAVYDSDEEETTVVGTFNLSLVDGETYVVMATGVASPDDFAANPDGISTAFDLAVFAGATETGTGTGSEVTALVYHGATDAPAVDVNAGGATVVGDIEYKEFVGLAQLPAAALTLDINVAGTMTTAATFSADISGLGGGAAVVFASGFLSPLDNQGGANFALLAALPDGTVVKFPEIRDEIVVTDNTGAGTTTWTSDNIYVLDGFVFVNSGDTLVIEPGTVIKGRTGQGAQASALIVARGAYIDAQGTSTDPIIFTSIVDDTDNPNDIPLNQSGLWGGVIILGNASLNSNPGETAIEGIPTTESRGLYGAINGATNDEDNSGIFRYASIRHGSTNIGAGNEINGLTMGGVGSGTTIEFVEVFNGADDGFEWFGGTVGTKWLVSAFNNDDAFDYDEGWRGSNQFWFAIQSDGIGSDRGGEHDGGTNPETGAPFATPVIYNATYIGRGEDAGKRAVTFRDNAGGEYHNSIFIDFDRGIDVEKLSSGTHSFDRLQAGELKLENNLFWNVAGNDTASVFTVVGSGATEADQTTIQTYFGDAGNKSANPAIQGIDREGSGGLDPRPGDIVAYSDLSAAPVGFDNVNFKGAFGSSTNIWAAGWTYLDELGFFPEAPSTITLPGARVQIIHNSGDPDARLVQISVNGEVAVEKLAYREATPFVEIPAGTAVVTVGVFNGDEDEIVASVDFSLELDADENYVVAATGVLSPDDFATNPDGTSTAFDLAILAGARETGQLGAGTLDFQLFHGATDAPAVDVLAGQFPLISNIAYKSFLPDYIGATAGTINLSVAPTGTNNVVATFEVDISGLGGGAAVGFASGFLDPLNNQGGANFALLAALPDGTVVSFPEVRDEVVVTDNTGDGTTTWTSDNIYVLDGFVFVEAGDTLIIEPGTIIKGRTGQGAQASALIVARGAYIDAQGTSSNPIIFTSIVDDTNNPDDIPLNQTGLWGGVIILGNATLNSEPGETAIEGIPTTETRGLYGGDDDTDNSGIFRYASIRHGSTNIGAGNEINGLTMGGVGSGTTIEFVEVFNSADDGFEWFGGTVNTKWLISAFNNDDAFDYDEGWRGSNQFWFAIQSDGIGSDRGGEHDGGTSPETGTPFATPVVYNATYIGRGEDAGKRAITFRDNAGGEYHNSIFVDYDRGIDVEKLSSGTHSFDRLQAGELKLENNLFWNVAGNDTASVFTVAGSGATEADQTFIQGYFGDNGNEVANPGIVSISRTNDGGLDPRPQAGVAIFNPILTDVPSGDFFTEVTFKGAFGSNNWARNWTYLEERGFFGNTSVVSVEDDLSEAERNLSIFPNPATSVISISVADVLRSAEVEMFNINGQNVFARSANAINRTVDMTIDVSTLPAGLYFVRVNTQEAVITRTVIVE